MIGQKHILIHHPVLLPAPHYGGTERVVIWLCRALVELGHRVTVVALTGSQLPKGVELLAVQPHETGILDLRGKIPSTVQVIHSMAPVSESEAGTLGVPWIQTIHGNGKVGERFHRNSVFLSADHARRHGAQVFVWNGLDPQEISLRRNRLGDMNPFLFFSKTSWRVKNLSGALGLCSAADVPLRIAGGTGPLTLRIKAFFQKGVEWVGPLEDSGKSAFFASGRAFLFPVIWSEPFGLVVAESLLSGTPVLGSRLGSLPELVPSDVGELFPIDEPLVWVDALKRLSKDIPWNSERCRQYAEGAFHYHRMAQQYLELYERIIAGESLQDSAPVTL